MTDTSAAAFNVNAKTWSITGITGGNTEGGLITENSFGFFNDSIDSSSSTPDGRIATITFTLTRTDGIVWADAASVFEPNDSGFFVAEHLGCSNAYRNAAS